MDAFLALGDIQYDCGGLADYAASYTPSYGRLKAVTRPVAGNHEYKTGSDSFGGTCPTSNATAANYFSYFGASAHPETSGHYSFDLGHWHIVALNANCSNTNVGGCGATSPQTNWLRNDLATTTQPCIAAIWHQPLYTGLNTGSPAGYIAAYKPWWDVLKAAGADIVLNGHSHNYQRFASMNSTKGPDPGGLTEYIIGTGGEEQVSVRATADPQPVFWSKNFGYLRLSLHEDGWSSEFRDVSGAVVDPFNGKCHE
jgi:hypothetical protein